MNAETITGRDGRKLTPDMVSFRQLVLAAVRDYINENGGSPSYGELAARLQTNRERVRQAVKRLARDGQLVRTPGPRGLRLPGLIEEAKRQLRDAGYVIDDEIKQGRLPLTKRSLLPPAELRYPARASNERDGDGEQAA